MDILIFILAIYGLFLIPSLVGAGVADAVRESGKNKYQKESGRSADETFVNVKELNSYERWLYEHRNK